MRLKTTFFLTCKCNCTDQKTSVTLNSMHLHISLYYYCYYFTVADPEKPEKKSKADIICNNDTEITARIFRCKYYHF